MNPYGKKNRNITAGQAVKIMRKNGVEMDEKKAEEVLDLMYFLAELIVKQNFTHKDSDPALSASTDQDH